MDSLFTVGIDEVGRGSLAGPVCAVAVAMKSNHDILIPGLNDSKKLSSKKRTILADIIMKNFYYGVGWISPQTIDSINILEATLRAMTLAINRLPHHITSQIEEILIDGNRSPNVIYPTKTIIKGDQVEESIMMASIVAKVIRDKYMQRISLFYPEYHFEKHSGYPTRLHREKIMQYGKSPIHRISFSKELYLSV
ncbi:ribonuclease HII [Entomospira nematocerorum]|uniref:Ribonuclease HII n=1 Tax=Entomospira nematocerorum TaxID=2719987 RepID=A0A968GE05_9SPIO|nr:ribonuclease HII [Entomospira nematocera]NIZ47322.1 ribonuclease HII [Entomospira nematocera]WDI34136.1 ribonuclease HII [Entomospira nematocera]